MLCSLPADQRRTDVAHGHFQAARETPATAPAHPLREQLAKRREVHDLPRSLYRREHGLTLLFRNAAHRHRWNERKFRALVLAAARSYRKRTDTPRLWLVVDNGSLRDTLRD